MSNEKWKLGMRGQVLLTKFSQPVLGEGKRKGKKEKKVFRESVFNFSLDFPTIGPAVSGKTRSKVDPYCKSYAWVPVLWSFDKL